MKRALILGIGGQDGSYLAELLLEKGYEVHGLARRSSYDNLARIAAVRDRVTVHRGDLCDHHSLIRVMHVADPDEVYNMADQDEVGWSTYTPGYSVGVTYGGVASLLEILRYHENGKTRFFQPLSSTMFGLTDGPQDERTPLNPGSPYACAKAAAWHLCKHYRRDHGVWVACGIMFNHDSPRRGPNYLLQQIARQAVDVARGRRDRIELTGPDSLVSVGHAADYMDAAWRIMQRDDPRDYVVGVSGTVRISALCRYALNLVKQFSHHFVLRDDSQPEERNQPDPKNMHDYDLEWEPKYHLTEMVLCDLVNRLKEVR